MKICHNCSHEFEDSPEIEVTPAEVMGEMFLEAVDGDNPSAQDAGHLCPACREKLGIVNLSCRKLAFSVAIEAVWRS